ncbi:PLP-dependent transferase [Auriscalpium vulgare]|uniref:PLP-dependent transferase n=1 Tax=Auriscalpium vulgare TaxID=40419 RepID=A0ACB8S4D8_9AGAM|nr:PLP-dependent transferase [Auriscalpium vulgare]
MTSFINTARSHFPSLESGYIFADNAGGSQCARDVVDKLSDYLLRTNVQLGADYSVSVTSTRRVAEGVQAAATLFNAGSPDEVAFASSSTMNMENLARALEGDVLSDEEIIVTGEHEANVGPWKKLAHRKSIQLKYWRPRISSPNNPYSIVLDVEDLLPLITSKTRLVAFTACSNILGSIVPVKDVIKATRAKATKEGVRKIEFSVDCVAYAPHRRIDVQDWDVDYAVFSFYKVYGPHISALYARAASLHSSLSPLTHHFLRVVDVSYKLNPGGPGYETVYAVTGVLDYLRALAPTGTDDLDAAFAAIAAHEQALLDPLLAYLRQREPRGVRIVGSEEGGLARAPTLSFVVVGERPIKSKDVVKAFDDKGGVGIRYGHFYAHTLVDELEPKLDIDDAVVRISLVHYNTVEEVTRIIEILDEVLA